MQRGARAAAASAALQRAPAAAATAPRCARAALRCPLLNTQTPHAIIIHITSSHQDLSFADIKERFLRPYYLQASFALGTLTLGLRTGALNYALADDVRCHGLWAMGYAGLCWAVLGCVLYVCMLCVKVGKRGRTLGWALHHTASLTHAAPVPRLSPLKNTYAARRLPRHRRRVRPAVHRDRVGALRLHRHARRRCVSYVWGAANGG